ncbi:MAG: DNA-processing protein DprA [Kiritimatiellia bacterium]
MAIFVLPWVKRSEKGMTAHQLLIALNRVPGVGFAKVRSLERAFGSLTAAAGVSEREIAGNCKDLGPRLAAEVFVALHSDFALREEERAAKCSVRLITLDDPEYPDALRALEMQMPPLVLYCVGDVTLLRQTQVAIIGTRRASVYGADQAKRFALRLVEAGLHVTSGLAEGIDSAAHEGALLTHASGKTIAVIGAALDCIYPASRAPLAREIIHKGGCIVSEYPFGRHADAKTFPQRNRLVASLAKAVFIVESPVRSGTLITADFAQTYGKQIYILPGRVDQPSFAGNHRLLREGIGRLVTCPEHILDDFGVLDLREGHPVEAETIPVGLTDDEALLYEAVGAEGATLDTVAEKTGLPMAQLMTCSITLQMRKRLIAAPGGLLRRAPHL